MYPSLFDLVVSIVLGLAMVRAGSSLEGSSLEESSSAVEEPKSDEVQKEPPPIACRLSPRARTMKNEEINQLFSGSTETH